MVYKCSRSFIYPIKRLIPRQSINKLDTKDNHVYFSAMPTKIKNRAETFTIESTYNSNPLEKRIELLCII